MPKNPPDGYPRVCPYLLYEDAGAALDWLVSAFGFRERMRMPGPDGAVMHAEAELDDAVVLMGCPGPEYRNPKSTGVVSQVVLIYVDEVEAHCARAVAAGARVVAELEDKFYGDRSYTAEDPEGHQWTFAQHVRDVSPEEMQRL